jgi:hypothetical protein
MFIFAGCATTATEPHKHDKFTKHYEESLFEISKKGMFSVEMVVKEPGLMTGVNAVDLIVHDKKDKDTVGAEITFTPWMPEMGHGVFEEPVITEKGGGLYTIENIVLIMSGHWELRVNIKKGDMEDTAVFDFRDVKIDRGHTHEMIMPPAASDLDLSMTRASESKNFNVSYQSTLDPIPINKIHTWTLMVKTANGSPVENAEIAIDGDMPEHGHGLPTQPEVTEELGAGKYMAEGMKFSMPGWWVMTFNIKAGGKEDIVTFNLLLRE